MPQGALEDLWNRQKGRETRRMREREQRKTNGNFINAERGGLRVRARTGVSSRRFAAVCYLSSRVCRLHKQGGNNTGEMKGVAGRGGAGRSGGERVKFIEPFVSTKPNTFCSRFPLNCLPRLQIYFFSRQPAKISPTCLWQH